MIYVSSNCLKTPGDIAGRTSRYERLGFTGIELTGGFSYVDDVETVIDTVIEGSPSAFRLHNYFPAPEQPIVLNLASTDRDTLKASRDMVTRALKISDRNLCGKFGAHAGFAIDIPVDQIGKKITRQNLVPRADVEAVFAESLDVIRELGSETQFYIENNVLSSANYREFGTNPFLCTDADAILPWIESHGIKLLLDVAHLKVSCQSLGLNFKEQLELLWPRADYLHLSDNNSFADENKGISRDSELYAYLADLPWEGKTATLEVYSGEEDLLETNRLISELMNA